MKIKLNNNNKLYYDGILKVAGPFGKNDLTWRGIFVFDPIAIGYKTKAEAEKYVQSNPAVAARLFAVNMVPWYSTPIGSFTQVSQKT